MAEFCYLTDEMQRDQALIYTENWKKMYQELKSLKDTLMNKLIRLSAPSLSLHDAQFDPLVIKGLCLALDQTYRVEDINRIHEHCEALDKALASVNINAQMNSFSIPGAEDEEKKALQVQILASLLPIAQKANIAWLLGKRSYHVNFFFYQALTKISSNPTIDQLKALSEKSRAVTLLCVELLEHADSNY